LRWAQHEWDKSLVFLAMRLASPTHHGRNLTQEEQAQYKVWKVQYLKPTNRIQREIMEAGGIIPR